jgi:hypothetical protein
MTSAGPQIAAIPQAAPLKATIASTASLSMASSLPQVSLLSSTKDADDMLTDNDIIEILKEAPGQRMSTKDLIAKTKRKLKKNPKNQSLLAEILKRVAAKVEGGLLELRKDI